MVDRVGHWAGRNRGGHGSGRWHGSGLENPRIFSVESNPPKRAFRRRGSATPAERCQNARPSSGRDARPGGAEERGATKTRAQAEGAHVPRRHFARMRVAVPTDKAPTWRNVMYWRNSPGWPPPGAFVSRRRARAASYPGRTGPRPPGKPRDSAHLAFWPCCGSGRT